MAKASERSVLFTARMKPEIKELIQWLAAKEGVSAAVFLDALLDKTLKKEMGNFRRAKAKGKVVLKATVAKRKLTGNPDKAKKKTKKKVVVKKRTTKKGTVRAS